MKKRKLKSQIKEIIFIITIDALILCAIKIGCMRMGQQKNDLNPASKVVLVKKI